MVKYDLKACKIILKELATEDDDFFSYVKNFLREGYMKESPFNSCFDHFFPYCGDYLSYCTTLIDALPEEKETIISQFVDFFQKVRAETDLFYKISYSVQSFLRLKEVAKAPFEVVKACISSLGLEGCSEAYGMLYITSNVIANVVAHPRLLAFVKTYYSVRIYFIDDSKLSGNDIAALASCGIEPVIQSSVRCPVRKDIIYSYYYPGVYPIQSELNLISNDIIKEFMQVRENLMNCILSSHYGKILEKSILEEELIFFVFDVVLNIPDGFEDVSPGVAIEKHKQYVLSSFTDRHPVCGPRRSSRLQNRNSTNFFKRKRRRGEHSLFGEDFHEPMATNYRLSRKNRIFFGRYRHYLLQKRKRRRLIGLPVPISNTRPAGAVFNFVYPSPPQPVHIIPPRYKHYKINPYYLKAPEKPSGEILVKNRQESGQEKRN